MRATWCCAGIAGRRVCEHCDLFSGRVLAMVYRLWETLVKEEVDMLGVRRQHLEF